MGILVDASNVFTVYSEYYVVVICKLLRVYLFFMLRKMLPHTEVYMISNVCSKNTSEELGTWNKY